MAAVEAAVQQHAPAGVSGMTQQHGKMPVVSQPAVSAGPQHEYLSMRPVWGPGGPPLRPAGAPLSGGRAAVAPLSGRSGAVAGGMHSG